MPVSELQPASQAEADAITTIIEKAILGRFMPPRRWASRAVASISKEKDQTSHSRWTRTPTCFDGARSRPPISLAIEKRAFDADATR